MSISNNTKNSNFEFLDDIFSCPKPGSEIYNFSVNNFNNPTNLVLKWQKLRKMEIFLYKVDNNMYYNILNAFIHLKNNMVLNKKSYKKRCLPKIPKRILKSKRIKINKNKLVISPISIKDKNKRINDLSISPLFSKKVIK